MVYTIKSLINGELKILILLNINSEFLNLLFKKRQGIYRIFRVPRSTDYYWRIVFAQKLEEYV